MMADERVSGCAGCLAAIEALRGEVAALVREQALQSTGVARWSEADGRTQMIIDPQVLRIMGKQTDVR